MIHRTINLYDDRDDVTLTTYLLEDSPELLNGQKRPAVLVCPGGAYLGCSDREADPVALRFMAMGYHAFVLRYSTYFEKGQFGKPIQLASMPVKEKSLHPAPMRDIGKAFLTIHAHADEWLVDVDKIAICGFSAGGHNCAMYSVYWHEPIITHFFGEDASLFKPAASILCYALCDYGIMLGGQLDEMSQEVADAASIAFLGTVTPSAELLEQVSPVLHVSKQTPPTFLWATADDALVPAENTTRMATALAQANVPFEVHIFEQGVHGLSLADQSTAGTLMFVNPNVEVWISLAQTWLHKRFHLILPEKPE